MGGRGRRSGGASGEEVVRASVLEPGRRSYCAEDSAAASRGTVPQRRAEQCRSGAETRGTALRGTAPGSGAARRRRAR
ncbi:UNVERIFIED_CONTAM: hypothetical protein Sradi_0902400 [Sesamum radiatum]|uniref:Uncharacterized protein n=1 Tax=Sesamum radiatum TaxID=300843 RepID=A0AAW2V5L1_SESRA